MQETRISWKHERVSVTVDLRFWREGLNSAVRGQGVAMGTQQELWLVFDY